MLNNCTCILLCRAHQSVKRDFRIKRCLVRIVDTREVLNLAVSGSGINPLWISLLTNLQRCINKDFNKPVCSDHVADLVARSAIRTDSGANRHAAMSHNFCRNKADAPDVCIAIFLTEAQTFRKMSADDISIQQGYLAAMLEQ